MTAGPDRRIVVLMHRLPDATHSLLRIVSGLLFIHPGGLKLLGWFGGMPEGVTMSPLIFTAGLLELVLGPLIMVGLFTRPADFIASGEMAFAYFIGHFPQGFWPIQNQGQPAVLFCFIFLFLAFNGPGSWSLDHLIGKRRRPAPAVSVREAGA